MAAEQLYFVFCSVQELAKAALKGGEAYRARVDGLPFDEKNLSAGEHGRIYETGINFSPFTMKPKRFRPPKSFAASLDIPEESRESLAVRMTACWRCVFMVPDVLSKWSLIVDACSSVDLEDLSSDFTKINKAQSGFMRDARRVHQKMASFGTQPKDGLPETGSPLICMTAKVFKGNRRRWTAVVPVSQHHHFQLANNIGDNVYPLMETHDGLSDRRRFRG